MTSTATFSERMARPRSPELPMVEAAEKAKVDWLVAYPFHRGGHVQPAVAIKEMLAGLIDALERGSTVRRVSILMADPQEQALFQQAFLQSLTDRT